MSRLKKIPELDWLRDLADSFIDGEEGAYGRQMSKQVMDLYRYLLWSRRYQLVEPTDPLRQMYFGLMLKYVRRLYPDTTAFEKAEIHKAEQMLKQVKRKKPIKDRDFKQERSISSKKRSIK